MQNYEKKSYLCKIMSAAEDNTPSPSHLFQRAPMFRVALALALGIVLAEYLPSLTVGRLCLAALVALATMCLAHRLLQSQWLFSLSLWVAIASMGGLLVHVHAPPDPFCHAPSLHRLELTVRLEETPRPTARSLKVVARVDSVAGRPSQGRLLLYMAPDSCAAALQAGDCLRLQASPRPPEGPTAPGQFDYRRFLRRQGVLYQCYLPSGSWQPLPSAPRGLRIRCARLQQHWVRTFRTFRLTPSQQGLAEALLLGWRADLDPATRQQFRGAGIAHLLALSGLHVGIMAGLVGAALFFLGRRRWQRVLKGSLQLLAVWFFVLLSGMSPATLRAGLMFSLLLLGDMMEQRPNSLNHLATSAVLICCFAPMQLFEVGFQLSYVAVLGILAWYQPLRSLIPALSNPEGGLLLWPWARLWQWACLSTAAQLAVLPLVLYYFHQFPTYFLLANLTVVPFAGLLLAVALLTLLSGGAAWLTALLRALLQAVDALTRWVSTLPAALLDNIYFDLPMLLLLVLSLLCFTLWLRCRRGWSLPALLACLILLLLQARLGLFALPWG